MTEVIWSFRATRDLNAIRRYISTFNPLAGQRMALRLVSAGDALVDFPERGVPISKGRRQLTTVRPYLLRYRMTGGDVTIIDIRHAAEDAP